MGSVVVKEACTKVQDNKVTVTICVEPKVSYDEKNNKPAYSFRGSANWAKSHISDLPLEEVGAFVSCLSQVIVDTTMMSDKWVLNGTYQFEHKPPKKTPVKKTPVKKAAPKKTPVKKAPVKKTPAKKVSESFDSPAAWSLAGHPTPGPSPAEKKRE